MRTSSEQDRSGPNGAAIAAEFPRQKPVEPTMNNRLADVVGPRTDGRACGATPSTNTHEFGYLDVGGAHPLGRANTDVKVTFAGSKAAKRLASGIARARARRRNVG
jgi:hypothetical protein